MDGIIKAGAMKKDVVYITMDSKTKLLCVLVEQLKTKTVVSAKVSGAGWKSISIPKSFCLTESVEYQVENGEVMKKKKKGRKGNGQKKIVKPKKKRLPKIPVGQAVPRIDIEGFDLRKNYRYKLSDFRAENCAAAKEKTCTCRCGGTLHGKSHKEWQKMEALLMDKSETGSITAEQTLKLIKHFGGRKAADVNKPKKAKKAKKAKSTTKKRKKK